jgi:hypothetical protein
MELVSIHMERVKTTWYLSIHSVSSNSHCSNVALLEEVEDSNPKNSSSQSTNLLLHLKIQVNNTKVSTLCVYFAKETVDYVTEKLFGPLEAGSVPSTLTNDE